MSSMQITTRIGCSIACDYCPQDKFIKAYKKRSHMLQMSFDNFKSYLAKIPVAVDIWFAGMCEPWLTPIVPICYYTLMKGGIRSAFSLPLSA